MPFGIQIDGKHFLLPAIRLCVYHKCASIHFFTVPQPPELLMSAAMTDIVHITFDFILVVDKPVRK